MLAWKQVSLEHAAKIEGGQLKIGRLSDYRTLENDRADDVDGGITWDVKSLTADMPGADRAVQRLGGSRAQPGMFIQASTFTYTPPPLYAFCMSETGCHYDPSPHQPKATFEVSVSLLNNLLLNKLSDRIAGSTRRRVVYARRRFDVFEDVHVAPDPFIKDLAFAEEREIRIVFYPRPDTIYETIFTEPDPEIGRLFRHVR